MSSIFGSLAPRDDGMGTMGGAMGGSMGGDGGGGGVSKIMLIHGIIGALATLLFLPIGMLIPRLVRGFSLHRWWFPVHGAVNGIIAFGLVIAAYAIGTSQLSANPTSEQSTHGTLGLTFLILMAVQTVLGVTVHWIKKPFARWSTKTGRNPVNLIHVILGIATIALGFATAYLGIDIWPTDTNSDIKGQKALRGLWGGMLGLTVLLYIVGLVFLLPRQRRMEQAAKLDGTSTPEQPMVQGRRSSVMPLNESRAI